MYFILKALSAFDNNGAILFPIFNVGIIVLCTLAALTIFSEQLLRINKLGILLAILFRINDILSRAFNMVELTIMMRIKALLAVILISVSPILAQKSTLKQVKEGMDYIYNQDFQKSSRIIAQIEKTSQKSAIPHLMKAMQAFWKYYPISLNEDRLEIYQNHLLMSYERSTEVLENDPENPEAIFLAMASQGLLAESYSDAGRSFKAVGAAKRAYNYIKKGSAKLDEFTEFYLTTGLYNYYREYYPDAYPIYKPFMSFFMKGDKAKGIRQLEKAAREASISHVIAQYYLSYIYMRYEYIPSKALRQGRILHQQYPNNELFSAIYLETLIINNRYQGSATNC